MRVKQVPRQIALISALAAAALCLCGLAAASVINIGPGEPGGASIQGGPISPGEPGGPDGYIPGDGHVPAEQETGPVLGELSLRVVSGYDEFYNQAFPLVAAVYDEEAYLYALGFRTCSHRWK